LRNHCTGMKNLCFANTAKFWGGGEFLHFDYACRFRDKGYFVLIIASEGSILAEKCENEGLPVEYIEGSKTAFLNTIKIRKVQSIFKKHSIDTVMFSLSEDLKLFGKAAYKSNLQNIVYLRELAMPVRNNRRNRFFLSNVVTHLIANSKETKRLVLQNFNGFIPLDKVKVIYHGLDFSKIPEVSGKTENGKLVIGNAGRLTQQKGQRYLIDLAELLREKHTNFVIKIAGKGDLEQELKQEVAKRNLQEYVQLLGFVENINAFMQELDLFVLTSQWEGFGFVIAEAMAAGTPVVAFDITSNPELVVDGKTGYLVKFPDVAAMAEKVDQLLSDRKLAQEMALNGRKRVEEHFRVEDKVNEIEKYILENK